MLLLGHRRREREGGCRWGQRKRSSAVKQGGGRADAGVVYRSSPANVSQQTPREPWQQRQQWCVKVGVEEVQVRQVLVAEGAAAVRRGHKLAAAAAMLAVQK